jgi:hypothetical protein
MSKMTRRQFAFWVGWSLFWLSHKARADVLDQLAAAVMRTVGGEFQPTDAQVLDTIIRESGDGKPDEARRARDGRPPSKWLRSLSANEIRIWLRTIDVPEFGVSGMTYWTHLTRDHSFDPLKINGLTIEEQAKLHAAAHFGY